MSDNMEGGGTPLFRITPEVRRRQQEARRRAQATSAAARRRAAEERQRQLANRLRTAPKPARKPVPSNRPKPVASGSAKPAAAKPAKKLTRFEQSQAALKPNEREMKVSEGIFDIRGGVSKVGKLKKLQADSLHLRTPQMPSARLTLFEQRKKPLRKRTELKPLLALVFDAGTRKPLPILARE